jgi:hypothetical protein
MNTFSDKKDESVRKEIGMFSNWAIGRESNEDDEATINAGTGRPVADRATLASQERSFWSWLKSETDVEEEMALNRALQSEAASQTNDVLSSILLNQAGASAPYSASGHATSTSPEDKAFLHWLRNGQDTEEAIAMTQSFGQSKATSQVNHSSGAHDSDNASKARLAKVAEKVQGSHGGDESKDDELEFSNFPAISSIVTYPNSEPNPQASSVMRKTGTGPPIMRATPQWGFTVQDETYAYEDESDVVLTVAQYNYETFYNLKPGTATAAILEHTSAGITGWASCVLDETPNKPRSEQDDSYTKQELKTEVVLPPSAKSPPRHRIGDEEESRELQMALLESLGVNVGNEAKRSLIHDPGPLVDTSNVNDEEDWSVEDDGFVDEQETVSLQSDASDEGLSAHVEGMHLDDIEGDERSDDMTPSFIFVQTTDGSDETGGSSLVKHGDSETDSEGTAENFVRVSSASADSAASDDWAML